MRHQQKVPSTQLRSSTSSHLQLMPGPCVKTRYGDRAFSVAAPKLWNTLPPKIQNASSLQTFKTMLKTHLFKSLYLPHSAACCFLLIVFISHVYFCFCYAYFVYKYMFIVLCFGGLLPWFTLVFTRTPAPCT